MHVHSPISQLSDYFSVFFIHIREKECVCGMLYMACVCVWCICVWYMYMCSMCMYVVCVWYVFYVAYVCVVCIWHACVVAPRIPWSWSSSCCLVQGIWLQQFQL